MRLHIKKLSFETFLERVNQINSYYDYSKVIYVNRVQKVTVICPEHGEFFIKPSHLFEGKGCKLCGINRRKKKQELSQEQWIQRSQNIHGNKYIYTGLYIGNKIKVEITCKIHGSFFLRPNNHLSGQGCPDCGKMYRGWNFSLWDKAGKTSSNFDGFKVYIILCKKDQEEFIKIGKTFNTLSERFSSNIELPYDYTIVKCFNFEDGISCSRFEIDLQKELIDYKYTPNIFFQGYSECFNSKSLILINEKYNE